VTVSNRGGRVLALLLVASIAAACGKKGAPLPPLLRVPAAAGDPTVMRAGDDVFLRFSVPAANADGHTPADINRVEVYAVTADRPPTVNDDFQKLRLVSTLVATEPVRALPPPLPPAKPGEPAPPPLPMPPGVEPGASVVIRDQLTAAARVVVKLPSSSIGRTSAIDPEPLPGPLVATTDSADPIRYYYVAGVSPNGRYGLVQTFLAVPLGSTSSSTSAPTLAHDDKVITIRWTPPANARGLSQLAPIPDALPSKPTVPGPEPTSFDVYEVVGVPGVPAAPDAPEVLARGNQSPVMPVPLTPGPVFANEITVPITTFAVERCFVVRPVDIVNGFHVRGPASPVSCITPKDTFPPTPPRALAAVASAGAVNLIWESSEAADVAGYLVLRGDAPGATLTPLTSAPISDTAYVDRTVRTGVTYTYAVVAVDKAGNRSPESNRVEETARQ
jgi:hypothetical protein